MKTTITVLLLFIFLPGFSQERDSYIISVQETPSAKMENKRLELLRNEDGNLLIFYDLKRQRLPLNEKDSLRIVTLLEKNDQESKDELFSIIEKTKIYDVDSLKIPKKDPIFKITDSFFQNKKELKRQSEEQKDNRIILDGTMYKIVITDSHGESFTFYAHSPTQESHPEFFKLVSALQNTYSKYKH